MRLKSITASACVVALLATSAPVAAAPLAFQPAQIDIKNEQITKVGHRHRRGRRHGRRHRNHDGALFALGVIGLTGLIIANSNDRRRYSRSCGRAWSRSWYDYCEWRYRTFDPRTGMYYYRPGRQRFCTC